MTRGDLTGSTGLEGDQTKRKTDHTKRQEKIEFDTGRRPTPKDSTENTQAAERERQIKAADESDTARSANAGRDVKNQENKPILQTGNFSHQQNKKWHSTRITYRILISELNDEMAISSGDKLTRKKLKPDQEADYQNNTGWKKVHTRSASLNWIDKHLIPACVFIQDNKQNISDDMWHRYQTHLGEAEKYKKLAQSRWGDPEFENLGSYKETAELILGMKNLLEPFVNELHEQQDNIKWENFVEDVRDGLVEDNQWDDAIKQAGNQIVKTNQKVKFMLTHLHQISMHDIEESGLGQPT